MGAADNSLVVVALCLFVVWVPIASAASPTLEVQHLLNHLNKPPLKSIQSPDGDIIDCILINQQSAFDHPLLKNHVIQMRPGIEREKKTEKSQMVTQLWYTMNETCPGGTIPVRRTKEEDLLRASSLQRFGKKYTTIHNVSSSAFPASPPTNHEYAIVEVRGDKYYGAKATINIWQPDVEQTNEFSVSQLWISAGAYDQDNLNTIEAGWQVNPSLYGDKKTRLFVYWTKDAYQHTGCHNLLCAGFFQTSNKTVVGAVMTPVSEYGGALYDIALQVSYLKDQAGGKWWLMLGEEALGYWPEELFTTLSESADSVEWGGEVINLGTNGAHTGTDMGSGHMAEEGAGKASYFKHMQVADEGGNFHDPVGLTVNQDHPTCYDLTSGNSPDMGAFIFYGGPGNSPGCP